MPHNADCAFCSYAFDTIGFIAPVTRDTPTASVVAAFTAYFGLTAFVVTEAFGELSSKRTKFNRWTARLFLVPCALCATYLARRHLLDRLVVIKTIQLARNNAWSRPVDLS